MGSHSWLKYVLHDLRTTCISTGRGLVAIHLLRAREALSQTDPDVACRATDYDWLGVGPIGSTTKLRAALTDIGEYLHLNGEVLAYAEIFAAIRLLEDEPVTHTSAHATFRGDTLH